MNTVNSSLYGLEDFDFNSLFEFYHTYPVSNYISKGSNNLHLFQSKKIGNISYRIMKNYQIKINFNLKSNLKKLDR